MQGILMSSAGTNFVAMASGGPDDAMIQGSAMAWHHNIAAGPRDGALPAAVEVDP
jgi:hypothetical protein